jgi:glycogen operon protein
MGVEGPTGDPAINELRERQMRNFVATLMFSQGVPMLTGGDEVARSQYGNNNAYCQDNELTWFDWDLNEAQKRLREFTCHVIHIRLAHPNLHRRKFFQDREIRSRRGDKLLRVVKDVAWFNPDGNEVTDEAWNAGWSRAIALLLNGQTLQVTDEDGEPVIDCSFLLLVNAAAEGVEFVLPESPACRPWTLLVDTESLACPFAESVADEKVILGGRSLKLFTDRSPKESAALSL